MLFHPAKVQLKVFSILFKVPSAHCDYLKFNLDGKIQEGVHGNRSEYDITFEIVKVFASIKDCA